MSPPLFLLPTEVFDEIFHLILPHEVMAAALSCKLCREKAKPHLRKHKELSETHRVVYLGNTVSVSGLISPLEYLERLVNDPGLAYYPRAIQLLEYGNEQYFDADDERDWETPFAGREKEQSVVQRQQAAFAGLINSISSFASQTQSGS
jgi:hypothetical protein